MLREGDGVLPTSLELVVVGGHVHAVADGDDAVAAIVDDAIDGAVEASLAFGHVPEEDKGE